MHKRSAKVIVVLGATLAISATPAPTLSLSGTHSSNRESSAVTSDEAFARVARKHPEFGGMFVDEQKGTLYIFLRGGDPQRVARALEEALGEDLPDRIEVRHAKFGYLQLRRWRDRLTPVLRDRGVTQMSIDHAKNRVFVGVSDSAAKARVERQLPTRGIPEQAVDVAVTGPVVADTPGPPSSA